MDRCETSKIFFSRSLFEFNLVIWILVNELDVYTIPCEMEKIEYTGTGTILYIVHIQFQFDLYQMPYKQSIINTN